MMLKYMGISQFLGRLENQTQNRQEQKKALQVGSHPASSTDQLGGHVAPTLPPHPQNWSRSLDTPAAALREHLPI